MKSIVVPDVHGCPHFLEWVLRRFPGRSLIFLGDLIHRGSDSRRTLTLALECAEQGRAELLWGNHEYWAWTETASLGRRAREGWWRNRGRELYGAYGEDIRALERDLTRFAQLARPYLVEGEMLCAHAARPRLGRSPDDLLDNGHLWNRPKKGLQPLPTSLFPGLTYSVHGHTPQLHPVIDLAGRGVVYLDLGSAKTGQFCVWDAEERRAVLYPEEA